MTLPIELSDAPHISVSTIESYIACPRKVWRQKFAPADQRLPFETSPALIAGSAAHSPVEKAIENRAKLRSFRWPDDWESITRPAARWYDQEFNLRERRDGYQDKWKEGEREKVYDGGLHASSALLAAVRDLDVVAVEEEFAFRLRENWTVKGRKDLRLADRGLADCKTEAAHPSAQWKWTQEKADMSLQAAIYAADEMIRSGALPPYFLFIVARKKLRSVANVFKTTVTQPRADMAISVARLVSIFIERGIFPCNRPACWGCPLDGNC